MRLLPLFFAVVLIGAVAGGLWNAANGMKGDIPQSFSGYRLSQTTIGPAAVTQMSRLHGKGVGVVDGYVAHYDGPGGGSMVYVGETASEKDAVALLQQMEGRIGAGNQYFTNLTPMTVESTRVFSVKSGQENHYFWQTGNKVVWVQLGRTSQTELAEAVRTFR